MSNLLENVIEYIERDMVFVQGGKFTMGDGEDYDNEPHEVVLEDFYLSRFPVTLGVWEAVMGSFSPVFRGQGRPMEQASWQACQEFLERINLGNPCEYRLPTEAEWEYAARGGVYERNTPDLAYAGSNILDEVGWWKENTHDENQYVGQKRPNALGLYDMSGNVDERCQDWYSEEYYEACKAEGIVYNPKGPETGEDRVVRGGPWHGVLDDYFRVSTRFALKLVARGDLYAFRIARD